MSCITYSVKEGGTGVLHLTDENGRESVYQPNCDLDKTQRLLYEYHALNTSNNKLIKESFVIDGVDWYPSSVSMLYWQFFFQYVKYESLIEDWKNNKIDFSRIEQGKFKRLLISLGYSKNNSKPLIVNMLRKILSKLIMLRNKVVVSSDIEKILFLRQSLNDFRSNEILQNIQKVYPVVQLIPFPRKKLSHIMFNSSICILPVSHGSCNYIDLLKINDKSRWIYHYAIIYTREIISQHITSYKLFNKYMSISKYKLFLGMDDCNYPYPYIYAAQDNGLKCIGIQHGGYAKRHEAYAMNYLNSHRWYDYLLVWGGYWKKVFLDNNKIFPSKNVFITSNKHNYYYTILPKISKNRSILFPYEFLADTILVGKFITILYANKFDIYFKPREDDTVKNQIKAYNLGDIENKLIIVRKITPSVMCSVDIVAGTMTTLLYDLLAYGKPIWILETPFKLQEDMVENGLARLISWNDLDDIITIYNKDMNSNKEVDIEYLNGDTPLEKAIDEIYSI